MMLYIPACGFTVVVLCNSDEPLVDPNAPARRVAASVMGAPFVDAPTVDVSFQALKEFSGCYYLVSQGHQLQVELVLKDQRLCVGDQPLRHIGGGKFVMQGSLLRVEFVDGSCPLQLLLYVSGEGSGVLWQRMAA
jgi:hypothetical protein